MTHSCVLIVEDDAVTRGVLEDALTDEGYWVETIDTAIGALALVRQLEPHAIVLDLGLPYRSGASLLAELKADPETAAIPVIVLSGMAEVLPPHRRAQASAVLAKPVPLGALFDAVRAAMESAPPNQGPSRRS
jgi:CheY-like chemotaxis protein